MAVSCTANSFLCLALRNNKNEITQMAIINATHIIITIYNNLFDDEKEGEEEEEEVEEEESESFDAVIVGIVVGIGLGMLLLVLLLVVPLVMMLSFIKLFFNVVMFVISVEFDCNWAWVLYMLLEF